MSQSAPGTGTDTGDLDGTAAALVQVGEVLLGHPAGTASRRAAEFVGEAGPAAAYDFLLNRYFEGSPRRHTLTPPELAALMAELAGRAGSVLDPACGSGELLAAAARAHHGFAPPALHGREADAVLARLAALRLALGCDGAVHVRHGDALREARSPDVPHVDAVLCHPPFDERAWGHDELAHDPRWEYGLPARTESELAWVQHSLSRLRPGGSAVLLMPPAAASRRAGRRIRGALLRRGALRAVVALPVGAAPPHHLPLHLWVLRRPDGSGRPDPRLLLVDAGARHPARGRERLDWPGLRRTVLDAWRAFDADGEVPEEPGVTRSRAVIDLLDDDIDLAPARHLPAAADPPPDAAPCSGRGQEQGMYDGLTDRSVPPA